MLATFDGSTDKNGGNPNCNINLFGSSGSLSGVSFLLFRDTSRKNRLVTGHFARCDSSHFFRPGHKYSFSFKIQGIGLTSQSYKFVNFN